MGVSGTTQQTKLSDLKMAQLGNSGRKIFEMSDHKPSMREAMPPPITPPDNSTTDNLPPTDLPVPVGGGVALAYPPPTHVLHHPLGHPVRLTGRPDSGGYLTGCRGDSVTLISPGNTPL